MPFNGSGTFNRIYSWVTDAANGIDVSSTRTDNDTNDIASGLSNCICKDGQTTITANIPFSSFKITSLGLGTASTDAARIDNANAYSICEFRLTLTTGVPVTTSDVTAATTLYASPYKGSAIALYDGTNWHRRTSTEFSITNAGLSASKPYDVFCYDNSGTPTLELLVWTNDTTRATALTTQDGVLCKTGAVTRRYLGTIYTDASSKFNDSMALRHVWNYNNRIARPMRVTDGTASWTYNTGSFRQANANTANQLDFVIGYSEDHVQATLTAASQYNNTGTGPSNGIGLDSTSSAASYSQAHFVSAAASATETLTIGYGDFPGVGRHTLVWLESGAGATTTFIGTSGSNVSVIRGTVFG